MDAAGKESTSGGIVDATIDAALKALRTPVQTQRTINAVLALCAFGIVVMGGFAVTLGAGRGSAFFTWAVLSALASTLAGGVLGLLFGLPIARKLDSHAAATAGVGGGYEESTSLEQIADWLTKIIVGLTLTQFATWSSAFDRVSLTITHDLLCPAATGQCGFVPGASLVSAYALAGFVIAYMWTRRFFILELVARDDSVRRMIEAQEQREEAEKEGRVQTGRNAPDGLVADNSPIVEAILEDGRRKANGAAKEAAQALTPGADGDDPWRGAFGGSPATNNTVLTATVSPVPGQPKNFEVDVIVAGATPERQRELAGQSVLFYLHPTFGKGVRAVSFGADGRASLVLYAYGAFTIGALLTDGTKLELNLATLPGVPDEFRIA